MRVESALIGLYRVVIMVYCNLDYEVAGLYPPSRFLRHDVSETNSVSVFRCGAGGTYSVGSLRM